MVDLLDYSQLATQFEAIDVLDREVPALEPLPVILNLFSGVLAGLSVPAFPGRGLSFGDNAVEKTFIVVPLSENFEVRLFHFLAHLELRLRGELKSFRSKTV